MTWKISLSELSTALGATLENEVIRDFDGVSTDSRAPNTGKIFFALKGENFDGHDFLDKAIQSGAAAVVVHKPGPTSRRVTVLRVPDTLRALQALGAYWRKKWGGMAVAISGSNGKTTTKEFAATVVSVKLKTHFSKGSFNNHFGVPLSLLSLQKEHQVGIFELGMNHAGELAHLTPLVEPDVALLTNVGRAHAEFFSSLEKVAAAKEELFQHSPAKAIRIINWDNPWTRGMRDRVPSGASALTFSGEDPTCDVYLRVVDFQLQRLVVEGHILGVSGRAEVPVFGIQNLYNLMGASAVGLACGLEPKLIWEGLTHCRTTWGRNQFVELQGGASVLFDGYNANPDSMAALFENMERVSSSGRRFLVLGEMLETGERRESFHQELGRAVGGLAIEGVTFVGPSKQAFQAGLSDSGFKKNVVLSDNYNDSLASELLNVLKPGDMVFVKGSRGTRLERFVLAWNPKNFQAKA